MLGKTESSPTKRGCTLNAGTVAMTGGRGVVRIRSVGAWEDRVSLRRILSRLGNAQASLTFRSLLQNLSLLSGVARGTQAADRLLCFAGFRIPFFTGDGCS